MHKTLPRRLSILVIVAGLAVALGACSSSGSKGAKSPAASGAITIANLAFSKGATAKAGSTVTATNNDTTAHTVTSDDGTSFNMRVEAGKSATFTAPSKAGTYKFHCNIHSTMHGTLEVT